MSDSRPRLCVVPRWAANQRMEWYDWLCTTEAVRDSFSAAIRPDVDDWQAPAIDSWIAHLHDVCGDDPTALANTFLVAHSVGCQGVIRYLATLPEGVSVAGCLLVAGWWTLDEAGGGLVPWVYPTDTERAEGATPAREIDFIRVRAACSHIVALISDNDPYTGDWQQTRRDFEARISARVQVIPGAEHFNASEAPVVRDALVELLAGAR